jgi:uncharacterized lipoprotein YddW (UPF0748 family)
MKPSALALLAGLLLACLAHAQVPPKREFRGVWIATVNNIDWPTYGDYAPEQQQEQFRGILRQLQQSGINALFVQVRPAADAFYRSRYEPWSEWLTGKQGKAPEPYYDPLAFMIEEAHRHNMELHAWVNPYRAVPNRHRAQLDASHITKKKPHWFLEFGQLTLFDPGIPEARDYISQVIADIVEHYDVDGIHFDDYFYPYPSNEHRIADDASYRKYGQGFKSKADWRRSNVDLLIEQVHSTIKRINPRVKFGVSPYGVWRNADMSAYGSETRSGLTSYDHLYADVRNWLEKGWIDYVVPQLYHHTKHKGKPFRKLVWWWAHNSFNRHLYIGHAAYRLFADPESSWNDYREMPRQVRYLREFRQVMGSAYYSSKAILKNSGSFRDSLRREFYRYPALVPPMPWKDPVPPAAPPSLTAQATEQGLLLRWTPPPPAADQEGAARYVLYRFGKGQAIDLQDPRHIVAIVPGGQQAFLDRQSKPEEAPTYALTALDRLHNESEPTFFPAQPEQPDYTDVGEVLASVPKEKPFDAAQPMKPGGTVTYAMASYFYRLAVRSSQAYVGVPEDGQP